MFKYLISFVLLVGCGGSQTPTEITADNMLHDFVADCKKIHGEKCSSPMIVHSLSESLDEQTCWIEDRNPIRQVVLHKGSVTQGNRTVIYNVLFECNLNLGTLETNVLKFDEFALALGLTRQERQ